MAAAHPSISLVLSTCTSCVPIAAQIPWADFWNGKGLFNVGEM